ncbi:MAG: TfoX/Sxy family protein [Verrucomicrobiales bacterium]|nr:TfoX/Sxy family protein [Verrucomicrobiales bacterium]
MKHREVTIAELKNIGPTIARRLREIGIHTKADLEAIGPVAAYRRICEKRPGKTIPACYYLYSLEGALRGVHWDAISATVKQSLRNQRRSVSRQCRWKAVHDRRGYGLVAHRPAGYPRAVGKQLRAIRSRSLSMKAVFTALVALIASSAAFAEEEPLRLHISIET